ncbi:hypothetical protein C8J57DRAFT_1240464 [Mycena rebaudengoi]|nr:hypothetical protein C8J57DRAFT_1240464 [Mycena rebaudengoi]
MTSLLVLGVLLDSGGDGSVDDLRPLIRLKLLDVGGVAHGALSDRITLNAKREVGCQRGSLAAQIAARKMETGIAKKKSLGAPGESWDPEFPGIPETSVNRQDEEVLPVNFRSVTTCNILSPGARFGE